MNQLLPFVTRDAIQERLPLIFPPGTPNRLYIVREMAASTIFVMIYMNAIEGNDIYLGPIHVYRMTREQAALGRDEDRVQFLEKAGRSKISVPGTRWYMDTTRESIRDETIREGLIQVNAVLEKPGVPTTSGKPRYRLKKDFAALFNPSLAGDELKEEILKWQETNLSKSALTRLSLAALGTQKDNETVLITFPNKDTRRIPTGLSSEISKAVIEVFANRFLKSPAVLWVSTSGGKVNFGDDQVASAIGLNIEADKNLPDIILVDLEPRDPLLVFVEVVATDGPITERRQNAIYELTGNAGFNRNQVTFVTAYIDRDSSGFSKTIKRLAWNSFAWFVSEPEKLIVLADGPSYLSAIMQLQKNPEQ